MWDEFDMKWAMKAITSFCGSHTVVMFVFESKHSDLHLSYYFATSQNALAWSQGVLHGQTQHVDWCEMHKCVGVHHISFCQPWQSCKSHRRRFIHSSRHKTTAACRPVQVLTVSPYVKQQSAINHAQDDASEKWGLFGADGMMFVFVIISWPAD